jgi:uncharacterized protein
MNTSADPRKLDVAAAAARHLSFEGRWPLADLSRLAEGTVQDGEVHWRATGERRSVGGSEPQTWLYLQAQARLWRDCQRCLQPVALDLVVERRFRFVADEATAEALDAESEDDVLALPRRLDLQALIEDELLLTLPIVPMHLECPTPLLPLSEAPGGQADKGIAAEPVRRPFDGLAVLKRRAKG